MPRLLDPARGTSRYTVPIALSSGAATPSPPANAMITSVAGMPSQLVKTLTGDRGARWLAGGPDLTALMARRRVDRCPWSQNWWPRDGPSDEADQRGRDFRDPLRRHRTRRAATQHPRAPAKVKYPGHANRIVCINVKIRQR